MAAIEGINLMSIPWIKVESTLPDKLEVLQLADWLDISPDEVVGKLLRLWIWVDLHFESGQDLGVTAALIDRVIGCAEFSQALIFAGWLVESEDGKLTLPNFDRHNGTTARQRACAQRRMQRARAGCAGSVTEPSLDKIRIDKNKHRARVFKAPTIDEVRAYCDERSNGIDPAAFVDHYEANGWMRGKSKLKDWKAAVRTWERRRAADSEDDFDLVRDLVKKHWHPDIRDTEKLQHALTGPQMARVSRLGLNTVYSSSGESKALRMAYRASGSMPQNEGQAS